MLPVLRLLVVSLGVLLISSSAAQAASKSLALPAEGQVAVTFASGVKSVKVKSAPAGVTVAGGVKGGKLAVAVVRPRGAAASGKVVLTLKGKAKGAKTVAAALDGGKAPVCAGLDKLLAKRLKGTADVKGLAAVLAAKLCGRPAPADAAATLGALGLGAVVAPAPPAASGVPAPATPAAGGRLNQPGPGPTPTPPAGGGKPCTNGADDDNDGQTDLEDPGCADGSDGSETGEVPVSAECLDNRSGVGQGEADNELTVGINRCGQFTRVRVDAAPGVASCEIFTGGVPWTCTASAGRGVATGPAIDTADALVKLTGPANCARKVTLALYRPNGEVAELHTAIRGCGAKPACENGKDDDGDGMIDDHFAEGATDPDPGCSATDDTTENSEIPAPAGCRIDLGVWDDEGFVPGAMTQGCGAIQGFWFRAPGTVQRCVYRLGEGADLACQKVRQTGGTMFDITAEDLRVGVELTQAVRCEPMTLALIKDNHQTWFFRGTLNGC
ncbi:hypothetical protein DVA67_005415 [Solirubrobacter sp. CPCC 204708]|uniref:Ig-like domain-containing protein n=1 Tax=Solirubrobacter deserti TaxID=2282478 RepID=A0ABT4RGT7_9ACTN|nr:hypothetical protein [Solirubrobacter deserti]MBE2315402.1 hypothetical protein [Solirubrobacter deserti]MDA0137756.1 hypothetical protein [Solirubrobacter deserti]